MSARKAAIVTGGGTGVGAATALLLARRGYDVLINYSKSETEAKESARACREAGADALLAQGDVAEDAACRRLVAAAVERWKRLDVLVNNAGISTFVGSGNWEALDAEAFQRIYAVNLLGAFQMIRAAAPHLKSARGAIVNVSSVAGALGIGEENAAKLQAGYEAGVPLGTSCTAEDVAEAIVWLADGARTVTGELVLLDSGLHLGSAMRAVVPPRN